MTAVDTHLLLRALVDELSRCGVRDAVTSPGSRNTPIIEALVAHPDIRAVSHLDERSAGFHALGMAKVTGAPVLITATSGTAVANLLPAVVEAHEARVPLIVLAADRPAELREVGAGQTIDQVKIFGDAVRWYFEVDFDRATPARMRWARGLACRAHASATGELPGPVHLNIPLREPLVLDGPLPPDPPGAGGRPDGAPWTRVTPRPQLAPRLHDLVLDRAVIVAGELDPAQPELGPRLAALAARAGIPLLADPLSRARAGAAAIAHYDLILRSPEAVEAFAPRTVLRIGELPTSKPLRAWLEALEDATHIGITRDRRVSDAAARLSERHVGPLGPALEALEARVDAGGTPPSRWLAGWRSLDAQVAAAIAPAFGELSEPRLAAELVAALPEQAALFVAASMPIRDLEEFAPRRERAPLLLANRGANGIDGTVSTALGVAARHPGPTVLLIGDVALAHDIGGLLLARRHGLALTIVLVNNDGGGIFHFLAIAEHADAFESHVATPHGLDFAHAAALYGFDHVTPDDVGGITAALNRSLDGAANTIIEVRTDRAANRQLHADIAAAARQALGDG